MTIQATQNLHVPYENVNIMINNASNQITMEMVRALMSGLQEKLDFKQLAEKHINPLVEVEIESSDGKTQMVFQKLLMATFQYVQTNSKPIEMTFVKINDVIPGGSAKFLSSFVLPATKSLIATLEVEEPEALNAPELWAI